MAAEFITGLSIFKSLLDSAKGLKDLNDVAVRNAAIVELQEKILAAQAQQTALVERISNLEKQVAQFEAWDAEKQRYKLTDYGGGTFAYELKPEAAEGEPPHRLCAACYQRRHKSILQFDFRTANGQDRYDCTECKSKFELGARQQRTLETSYRRRGGQWHRLSRRVRLILVPCHEHASHQRACPAL